MMAFGLFMSTHQEVWPRESNLRPFSVSPCVRIVVTEGALDKLAYEKERLRGRSVIINPGMWDVYGCINKIPIINFQFLRRKEENYCYKNQYHQAVADQCCAQGIRYNFQRTSTRFFYGRNKAKF